MTSLSLSYFDSILRGGGGFTLFLVVVKLDFEIAVDQQTKAHDQTFEGVLDSGCPPVPRNSHAFIWLIFGFILPNHLNMLWSALLVATSLLNTEKVLSESDKNWLSYEQNTICPYLGIRHKYYRFWPINIFE